MAVSIRALADEDVSRIVAACATWDELAPFGPPYWRPRSPAELRRKIAATAGPQPSAEYNFVFVVDESLVGECSVHAIDWRNRVAQLGVCIWDPADRAQGYGRAAVQYLIDWTFGYLGLARLEAWIVEGNKSSLKLFDDLGFMREGTLQGRYLCAGQRRNMYVLALLAPE
jgi:RimJ/RimL family protein N-acetyltransferase